ncbi:hypothetical protein [Pectobacterium polaris]|uniref:hypothetical protein n=1 Tax=Pectobacterium polaris TaxID=2042057 RepID=UPI001CF56D66|nr:hypothetical protein [Pectobacterium polaris]MCA6954677.1 hypothetical protein [Pectobacterium polaris]
MKPEMSTAVMIERLRALASESQDSVLLSSVASRIELLLAAESGMSREMACIRHALDIPPDQSVQSGVVDAFVRLNAKIQDLSGQLSKPEPVYQYQSEIYNEDSGETELYWDDCDIGFYRQYAEDRRRILYSAPVLQAVGQPLPDRISVAEAIERLKSDPTSSKAIAYQHGWNDRDALVGQPYTVPDSWVKGRFAYDTLFNAIGKAVNVQGEALAISVKEFEDAMIADAHWPLKSNRIMPLLPVRDDMGFWCHPHRVDTPFDEGSTLLEMRSWYAELGMEVDYTYMNQFFCCDCVYDADIETYPARNWHPTPPEHGDGWILLSIFDTEEGPCAEWIRYQDGDA